MQELFIETPQQLEDFVTQVKDSPWLAVDTEFIRERTYYPRLCLVQVSNDRIAAAIDPLALEDLAPLRDLLLDPAIEKIFHAARQDQEIFLNEWDALPRPVFDTQPAAALLGYGDQVGYGKLIQQVLEVELAKDHSRTDWSRRPLDKAQLRYALDDVIFLGQAYVKMKQTLEKQGRLDWLQPEFELLTAEATYSLNPMDMWKKVKGRQHIKGVKLAVLQAVAAWREEQALARNLPRRWILKDEVLLEIARRAPVETADLEKIRGVDGNFIRHNANILTQRVQKALQLPREEWPRDRFRSNRPTPEQEAILDMLSAALRLIALDAGLSPQAIASRKDLAALLSNDEKATLLQGWRKQVAGLPLQELLQGKRRLLIENGRPGFSEG
jgi:ribonuclease D